MRKTKEEAGLTKENILDASVQVFNEKGYSQTSVEDIVTKLGLTRGAFYWHFKDKEDLLKQVVFREHTFIAGNIADSIIKSTSGKQQLESLLFNIIESFYSQKRYRDYVYLVRFRLEFEPDSFYFEGLTNLNDFIITETAKILEKCIQNNETKAVINPLNTAVHLNSLFDGMFRLYFALPKYLSSKEQATSITKDYLNIILK